MAKRWISCEVEDEYFGEERKRNKQERKQLEAKDRSKFKKTDHTKWLAQQKAEQSRSLHDDLLRGRVLSISSQALTVDCDGVLFRCSLRGLLRKDIGNEKNLVTVGDFVRFTPLEGNEGTIFAIEERKSILARADNLSRRKQQLIAANIDQVFITFSVVRPALKPLLADRYIIAADKGGMQPVLLINKIDLLATASTPELEKEKELYQDFIAGYISANIPVLSVSTVTGEGLDDLKKMMKDKASVFSGQSGVGKSSLINAVTGLDLKVGETVEKTQKGAHTTTTAQLIPLTFGGFCIDTPGIKSFGVWNLDRDEIEAYFDEIHALGSDCKFPNCHHLHEEACAVKEAVASGKLSSLRYQSYITLLETINDEHLRR